MPHMGINDPEAAFAALRATLPVLRERLTVEEAADLAAQMPVYIRGMFYQGWRPAEPVWKERHIDAFLDRVDEVFRDHEGIPVEVAVKGVFALLAERVSAGEIRDIRSILPADLRKLWPGRAAIS